jgi:hypothetical protein
MRFPKRRIASLAALSIAGLVWSGCEAKQQSEYVAGVSTQVKVPRDLQYIRLSVSVGGVRTFCRAYPVYNGRVQLPRSLGTFALNDPSGDPLTYQIIGYTQKLEEGEELNEIACGDKVGDNGARILRRSRQPYVKDEILFLPMPLKYSCYDTLCEGDDKTCKGGSCVDANVSTPADVFPKYSPELVDGSGGDCFSPALCMGAGLPAIPVKPDDCTYAVANTPSAPPTIEGVPSPIPQGTPSGDGVNVEVTYDGGYVREILDKDPDEGFTIPDASKPQQFRLAPGLCAMVKGTTGDKPGKRITAIRASATCRPKVLSQPICKDEAFAAMGLDPQGASTDSNELQACSATELKPPRTAIVVMMDSTKEHEKFIAGADVKFAIEALRDPAFYRADIAVGYTSGALACGGTNTSIALPLESAGSVVPKIQGSIDTQKTTLASKSLGTETPRWDVGLKAAYDELNKPGNPQYFRRAVIAIGDGNFGGNACVANVATESASARAGAAKPIETYVFDLNGNSGDLASPEADAIAAAGGTGLAVNAPGSDKAPAKDGFQKIVERLATCVYDPPQNGLALPDDGGTLSYNDPILPSIVRSIQHDAACTDGTQNVSGWGRGADQRIYICGQACTDYRVTLKNSALINLAFGQPPAAMPVFAHKKSCGPKIP